jgi:hypothetical protein
VTFHPAFTGTGITHIVTPLRYAPEIALPPYSYGHGHDLPHPVNDQAGRLFAGQHMDSPANGSSATISGPTSGS